MLARLIATAQRHAARPHLCVPRLSIRSSDAPGVPVPILFQPVFYMLLQGGKRMTMAGKSSDWTPGTCAVASVGLPFITQTIEATPERPYLGIEIRLDAGIVAGLLLDMPDQQHEESEGGGGAMTTAQASASVLEPFKRLVGLLDAPEDVAVLAPNFERELYYRLLQGPMGGTLRQIGRTNTRFAQIRAAATWICQHADAPLSVPHLAASVGMSVTSFHRHFKIATGQSPLAYQHHLRLIEARRRLASGSVTVTETAFASGYASAAQFSREYKRLFGIAPFRDLGLLRQA
ncbi:AraC family transcriptional regulator [Novosphingobium terrae]|uniref:AraC family transcriptional regulator n=1 Tax=Novosphingobium terrae TaxID=2726189 RepID=UPI00197E8E20|nr:AraC family transcriptional regulator [Novosphingobium terrae]